MGPLGNCVIALRCCGRSRESGRSSLITVVFIRLKKKKKASTYYVSDPVLHGWGSGDRGESDPIIVLQ